MMGDASSQSQTLQEYVDRFGKEELERVGSVTSAEAQAVAEMHVLGLFGDLPQLRDEMFASVGSPDILAPVGDLGNQLQTAMQSGRLLVLRFQSGELRRMLLEAMAFGGFLSDMDRQVAGAYE